jgi:hypothetical protein
LGRGVYIGKYHPGGGYQPCHLGENMMKGKRKRGECEVIKTKNKGEIEVKIIE